MMIAIAFGGTAVADQVLLLPNGAGDATSLSLTHGGISPSLRNNWGVNTTDDGDTSFVAANGNTYTTDLYQLEDVSLTGTITSVTVCIQARAVDTPVRASAQTVLKTGATVAEGAEITLGTSYDTYWTTYDTNPETGEAWTWDEINALQAGVALRRTEDSGNHRSRCTLVGVIVEYATVVEAVVDLDPDSLQVKSNGGPHSYTCYIELPEGYDVGDIDLDSIVLIDPDGDELAPSEGSPSEIGDDDLDGIPDLMVKFDRQALEDILPLGDEVEIIIAGMVDGTPFVGSDTIRVFE